VGSIDLGQSNGKFNEDYKLNEVRFNSSINAEAEPIDRVGQFDMKAWILSIILLAFASDARAGSPTNTIVELPRPNSGTFSFKQAERRKSDILSNVPTEKLSDWKNPYMGFCVHVERDDSVTVYNHLFKEFNEYSKPRTGQTDQDIKKLVDELPLLGNPAGILITSERPLKDSKAIHKLLKVLFVPSVQLFYVRSNEQSDSTMDAGILLLAVSFVFLIIAAVLKLRENKQLLPAEKSADGSAVF
jgi:hypothetical protein